MDKTILGPGDRIDGWVIERPLGTGGMGSVYRCRNASTDRIVAALKVLDRSLQSSPDANARFLREAEILAGLDHPNIVRVRNIRIDADPAYLEMEFVEGEALDALLRRGPLSVARSLGILRQAADAIAYAHRRGVRHRDLKPANLLVDQHDRLRIVDFGLATETDLQRITEHGLNFGTVSYSPPEWMDPDRLDPVQWDLYALGVILYELVTGRMAFPLSGEGPMKRQLLQVMMQKQVAPPLDPGVDFAEPVRALIRDLTKASPNERPQSADELVARVAAIGVDLPDVPLPGPPADAPKRASVTMPISESPGPALAARGSWWMPVLGTLAALAVVVSGIGAGALWNAMGPEPVAPRPDPVDTIAHPQDPAPKETRSVAFTFHGATAGLPIKVRLGKDLGVVERGAVRFPAVSTDEGLLQWVAGEQCGGCPGDGCAEWCGTGDVVVPAGAGALELNAEVRPGSGTVKVVVPALDKARLRKKGRSVVLLDGRAGEPVDDTTFRFAGVAPGRHRASADLGECPPDASGCWLKGSCPEKCSSQVAEVVVPWSGGERTVQLDLPSP